MQISQHVLWPGCLCLLQTNQWKKRGITMSAVKYGMILEDHGMPLLLSVYSHDGTVTVVQGGVEMGQGLFMKVRWHNFTSLECVPHGTVTVLKGSFKVGQTWWRWKRFTTSLDLLFIIGPSLLSRDVSRWEWLLLKVRWPRFTVVYPVSKWDTLLENELL